MKAIRTITAIILVLITVFTLFIPAVSAAENGIVEDFKVEFIQGADEVDGKYVFDATKDNSGLRWNRFIYRVNYALSGEGMLEPGKVQITLPTSIITDRDGNIADEFDIAVPHADDVEETDNDVKFVYTIEDDTIIITNRLEISSAQAGNIEIAYIPTKSEINYVDMKKSADVVSTFKLGEGGEGYTRTSTADGVYFNTSAVNNSTEVKIANFSLDWNPSWGLPKPENDDQYCYIVWSVKTSLSNATQYYDFQINNNVVTDNGEAIGYKFQNQTKYVAENHIEHQNSYNAYSDYIKYRYDYVLTKHLKSDVLVNECKITDNIETVVIPYDRVDVSTKSNGSDTYIYYNIQRLDNIGKIFTNKYGLYNVNDGEGSIVKDSNYISDGRLEEFRNGDINVIDKLRYLVDYGANGWNWKVLRTSTTIDSVEGFPTTYIVQDDTLKLNNNQTALETDDYDFTALKIKSANYDISIVNNTSITYDLSKPKNDIDFDVYVSVNGKDNYLKVATFHNQNHTWSNVNDDIVTRTQTDGQIFFKSGVDAWKVQASTDAFRVGISVFPEISLFRTERVLNQLGELAVVPLTNQANFVIRYNEFGAQGISERASSSSSNDYLADLSAVKKSYLLITPDSSKNNRIKKQYEASWTVNMHESIAKTGNVEQKSGRFYILLPIGATLENDSVSVTNGNGDKILPGQFRYDTIPNYKDSGRTMLVVDIDKTGENYYVHYNTIHSWANIKDYGAMTYTSAAYETGNKKIYNGFPDNGDSLTDNNYMNDLDSETDDEKFIYSSRYFNIIAVTTSSTGLTKLVQSKDDEKPVQSTLVHQNETYAYHIRIANDYKTRSKNIILFDSLENFSKENLNSNWKGTLQSVDTSNLTDKDVNAVVYYSSIENLDVSEHYNLTEKINGDKVWKTKDEFGDISNAKAIAIDCRKTVDGDSFVLDRNQSINIPIYFKSPNQVPDLVDDPETYNNIYLNQTLIVESGLEVNDFIHYDYTAVGFRTVGDVEIRKVDSTDHSKTIEGVVFNLVGRSDYGTEYNLTSTTDQNGYICFSDVEKGNYTITEIEGVIDYQEDHNSIAVSIDNNGNVTVEGKEKDGNVNLIENEPRIHGDLSFTKVDKISYDTGDKKLEGAEFRLSGKSDYGNDVLMYATSDTNGQVNFYNIELGTYTLTETKYPDNYRHDNKKYTVVCDNSGILSINVPLNSKGKYEIENEPYEEIKVYKVDADNPSLYLEGVQLRIHGTSDYGTEYDKTVTTNSNGVAAFGEMEIGKYILEEVQALENYKLDENKYVVTISANHTVTIEGLKKNNLGFWVLPNQRELNGKIKVTKVWKDNADNETRKAPKVHIGLKELERDVPTATFKPYFGRDYLRSAKTFNRDVSKSLSEVQNINGVTKIDDETTDKSIYIWIDSDNNGYWWSDAEIVFLPKDSSSMFYYCRNLTSLDLSGFDTSIVTDMSKMFCYCSSLTSLDLSGFDTSNVTYMDSMFEYCLSLTSLDVSGFDTSKVTDMSDMFYNCQNFTALDLSNFDTSKVTDMSGMFRNCNNLTSLDISDFDTSNVTYMDSMFCYCQNLISLDLSNFDTSKVTSMGSMFSYCQNLISLDVSGFDTSQVTDMSDMFRDCTKLISLNISNFDTCQVSSMRNMFRKCPNLTTLDLSNFVTNKVTDMSGMFYDCSSLTSLDVSNFDTSKVTDMSGMFHWCSNITTLDVSNFVTNKVTDMSGMFYNCSSLTSLDVSNFDTSKVTNMGSMFSSCSSITSLDVSGFDTSKVTDMAYMFYHCQNLTLLDVSGFDISGVTSIWAMFESCQNINVLDLSMWNALRLERSTYAISGCTNLKTIYASELLENRIYGDSVFSGDYNLVGGNGTVYDINHTDDDYARIDTAETPGYFTYKAPHEPLKSCVYLDDDKFINSVINKYERNNITQFKRNESKTNEEVMTIENATRVDTEITENSIYIWLEKEDNENILYWWSNAEIIYLSSASNLFAYWSSIKSIDLSGFNTSKATSMENMFYYCRNLTSLDLSNFDTSNVTSMGSMFCYCSSLTSLDLSNFNTSKVTYMDSMFEYCLNLTSLDVRGFDTCQVSYMRNMFRICPNLTTLDLSNFVTNKVTDMSGMFYNCSSLTSLDISGFDTSKVTNMYSMFSGCSNLTSLDLSGFNTKNVTEFHNMFYYNSKLKTISANEKFVIRIREKNKSDGMFSGDYNLVGGNGTVYDANHRDSDYARIDTAETPGYFTYKEYSPSTPTEPIEPTEPFVKPPISAEYATLSKSLLTETLDLNSSPYFWNRANIVGFIHDTSKTLEEVQAINGVVKVDDNATDKVIYIWTDNYNFSGTKTVYWWSNASTVYLPANSSYLFANLNALQNIDLTDFNASKVSVADSMFYGCSQLQTVGVDNWNTRKLTSAADMFGDCYALTTPNVSNWKTTKLTNVSGMFSNCTALISLDLNSWNTKNLENISSAFLGCSNLTTLEIGNWNTQSLTNMGAAFKNNRKLNPINIGGWNVSRVTNMREAFNYCRAITGLDVSEWDTSSLTDMQAMFKGCTALTSLDLSSWDTSNVTNMREAFSGDTALTTVYASDLFNTGAVTDSYRMFYNDSNIVGGKGTTFDSTKIDIEYANIDADGDPGYLTLKDASNRTYDSVDDGWTVVDENTWTYTFDVFDDSAQYFIYEEDMDGYNSDTSYEAKRRLNDGEITNFITITNTSTDIPEEPDITDFGSLTVTKTVLGDGLQLGTEGYIVGDFTFTLTLSGNDAVTAGTKVWGDRVYQDGVTTFKLHDRQSATFTGIPAGLAYTVEELDSEGYTVLTENRTGTIIKDNNIAVSFMNNWQGDNRPKNSFSLVKRVINGDLNDEFDFTVMLTNLYPKIAYKLSDNTMYYSDNDGEATVKIKLKADEAVTFQNLPVGATYQVTEKASPYFASYSVADALDLKMITSSSGSNTEINTMLSTGKETVEENEQITVAFTNEKIIPPSEPDPPATKTITVNKNWVNDNPVERPDSITVYLYQGEDLLKSAEITASDNWQTTFDNLLVYDDFGNEYDYSIIEADVNGYVTGYNENGNTYTITNTKVPVGNIEISNEIRGNAADFTKLFKYTVTLTDTNGNPVTASFVREGTKAGDMPFVNGTSTIYLTHQDDITIKDIPADYHFKIVQTEDALYTVTPDTATYEGNIIANQTIRNPYINELNAYGTLMIKKELESTREEDTNMQFDFTVSIVKGNEKLNGSYQCEGTDVSSITFTDGTASFKLKGGQTLSIKGLPVGADYEVKEVGADSIDFLTYADNEKGIISKNSEENLVRFKNVRNLLPETGSAGMIYLIGGSAFFLLLGFTTLLFRRKEKDKK